METAGDALRVTREAQGLSVREAANLADVSPAHLSRVERGERTATRRFVDQVARAFGRNIAAGGPPQQHGGRS